jgi:hypothetical protein
VALRVDGDDGDLQTIDHLAEPLLPLVVRRVEPRQFLNIEEAAPPRWTPKSRN